MTSRPDGEYVQMRRSVMDALLGLLGDHEHEEGIRQAGYREGQYDATHSYQAGYDLGHDTGLSARQDSRAFVHGILDGWAAGCDTRHQLARELLRQDAPRRRAQAEAEREAG